MLREVELAEPSGSGRAAAAAGAANADDDDDDDARLLPATLEPEAGGAGQGTTVSARFGDMCEICVKRSTPSLFCCRRWRRGGRARGGRDSPFVDPRLEP